MAVAPFDWWAQPVLDLSRELILTSPTPPTLIADRVTHSTTRSVYRVHWNTIAPWNDFAAQVIHYWNNVPQVDKQAHVMEQGDYRGCFQRVGFSVAGNEGNVRVLIHDFMEAVHLAAANGGNGGTAPRPSDRHSVLQQWEQGVEANELAGRPDLVMRSEYGQIPYRITVMVEAKNPWQVTPAGLDQVLRGPQRIHCGYFISDFLAGVLQVPAGELTPSRLALEQLFGYMVRNGKAYGVLTTMKGWSFLRRDNGGQLYITPMFGDFQARQGISNGAFYEGYYTPQGFSIMQALYYLSAIAETAADLPETPIGGRPGQVHIPYAGNSTTPAPTIQQPPDNAGFGFPGLAPPQGGQGQQYGNQGVGILEGYDQSECIHYDGAFTYKDFQFQPWLPENNLGPKTWIAIALPAEFKVIFKLWDAWKFDQEARNREASVYLQLRPLWGKCIPSLFVKSALEYFHALIFQYIKVYP